MNRTRIALGLGLVVLGLLYLADAADMVQAGAVVARGWPLVIVAAGGLALLDRPRNPVGALVVVGIGLLLLAMTTGLVTVSLWALLWPALLIGLGVRLMFGRGRSTRDADARDRIDTVAVLSGHDLAPHSSAFVGGSVVAVLGGATVDLRHAHPIPSGAELDVTAVLGGVDVLVPAGWRVEVDGTAVLGGYENHHAPAALPDDAPALTIKVLAILGAVDVKVAVPLTATA
jgi:predicted membrane protein